MASLNPEQWRAEWRRIGLEHAARGCPRRHAAESCECGAEEFPTPPVPVESKHVPSEEFLRRFQVITDYLYPFLGGGGFTGELEVATHTNGRWRARYFRDGPQGAAAAVDTTGQIALYAIAESDAGADVYFGPVGRTARGKVRGGTVESSNVAWLDVDPPSKVWETWSVGELATFRDDALERIDAMDPPPSFILDSGRGFQAYWRLATPVSSEHCRALNIGLAEAYGQGADRASTDPTRIMRMPATFNRKPALTALLGQAPMTRVLRPPLVLSSTRRHPLASLPCAEIGVAPGLVPDLYLKKALAHGRQATARGDRVSLCCVRHDDEKPSAFITLQGWYECSGCGARGPAKEWTGWPEVAGWGLGNPVTRPSRVAGIVRGSHSARELTPVLLAGSRHATQDPVKRAALFARGGELTVFDAARDAAVFRDYEDLAGHLQEHGADVFRTFWLAFALATDRHDDGRFTWSTRTAARELEPEGTKVSGSTRARLNRSLAALSRMHVRVSWSSRMKPSDPWPLVATLNPLGRGLLLCQIHPFLFRQTEGNAVGWFEWHRGAVRMDAGALAVYLMSQHWRSQSGASEMRRDLRNVVKRAGVEWNDDESRKNPGRYFATWASRFAVAGLPADVLGLGMDATEGVLTVTVPGLRTLPPPASPKALTP